MKQYVLILFFFLLIVAGHSQANDISTNPLNFNPVFISNEIPPCPDVVLFQGNFFEEQDSNDFNSFYFAIIQPTPPESNFRYNVKKIEIVLPLFPKNHITT